MKIFILKTSVFLLIIVVYFGINALVNYSIFYGSRLPLNGEKIIIAGDSHTEKSLNPSKLNSTINISQSAEPYIITYWKLRYIFKNHRPETLILGFSHHNISSFNDLKFWNEKWSSEMFMRSYIIGNIGSLENIKVDYKEFFSVYIRQMCLYPHNKHFNFIGGYVNNNKSDLSDIEQAIRRHYYYNRNELNISDTALLYLDNIIRLCKEKGVNIILIGSPVHKEYFRLIPSTVKIRYDLEKSRLARKNILVLDFTQDSYEDSLYLNADHLNEKGAVSFTIKIAALLKKPDVFKGDSL